MRRFSSSLIRLLGSEKFFYGIIALFLFQALWFALSAVYPMAFDEYFHFGLIQIHATHWSPFFSSVPPDSGAFGPLTRDNSYLFHYLMSFPYRLIRLFVASEEWQILILRFLNIAFFTAGLILFRRFLLQLASRPLVHFSLLMFVLVPITPMLAAHINYDNLIFLMLPIILLLTAHCARSLRRTATLPIVSASSLLILSCLTSITKYAFLPIFLGIFFYFVWIIARLPAGRRGRFASRVWPDFTKLPLARRLLLIALAVVSIGLFVERYAVNIVQYQALVPECSKVISVEHCSHYGPWARNVAMKAALTQPPETNFVTFIGEWIYGMLFRLFFAINYDHNTQPPVLLPISGAYIVFVMGGLCTLAFGRRLVRNNHLVMASLLIIGIYGASIFLTNYRSYTELGELVAVNGRYFTPLLPLIFVVMALAIREAVRRFRTAHLIKSAAVVIACLLFSQGSGILTFLVRSEADWYWPVPIVQQVNQAAKGIAEAWVVLQ